MGLADVMQEAVANKSDEATEELVAAPEESASDDDLFDTPKTIPYNRFAEVNGKFRAAEQQVASLQAQIEELNSLKSTFDEHYGDVDDPRGVFADEMALLRGIVQAAESDPEVRAALQKAQRTAGVAPQQSKPKTDPAVEKLMRETATERLTEIFERNGVRKELRPLIQDAVLSGEMTLDRDALRTRVKEFVADKGWTKDFLLGSPTKAKAVEAEVDEDDSPTPVEEKTTKRRMSNQQRAREVGGTLAQLLAERIASAKS